MPYTPPTYAQFKARYPRFAAVPEATYDAFLPEALRQVDRTWTEADYQPAVMLYTAHLLTLEGLGTGAEAQVNAQGAGGFKVMRSGSLTLERFSGKDGGAASSDPLDATSYGGQFKALRRQNLAGPRVI